MAPLQNRRFSPLSPAPDFEVQVVDDVQFVLLPEPIEPPPPPPEPFVRHSPSSPPFRPTSERPPPSEDIPPPIRRHRDGRLRIPNLRRESEGVLGSLQLSILLSVIPEPAEPFEPAFQAYQETQVCPDCQQVPQVF